MAQETAKSVPLPVPVTAPEPAPWPRLALGLVIGFAAVKLLACFLTVAQRQFMKALGMRSIG